MGLYSFRDKYPLGKRFSKTVYVHVMGCCVQLLLMLDSSHILAIMTSAMHSKFSFCIQIILIFFFVLYKIQNMISEDQFNKRPIDKVLGTQLNIPVWWICLWAKHQQMQCCVFMDVQISWHCSLWTYSFANMIWLKSWDFAHEIQQVQRESLSRVAWYRDLLCGMEVAPLRHLWLFMNQSSWITGWRWHLWPWMLLKLEKSSWRWIIIKKQSHKQGIPNLAKI